MRLLIILTVLLLASCQQSTDKNSDENQFTDCELGEQQAHKDAAKGNYKWNRSNIPIFDNVAYQNYYESHLVKRYGIQINENDSLLSKKSNCYNNTMIAAIHKKFGEDVFSKSGKITRRAFFNEADNKNIERFFSVDDSTQYANEFLDYWDGVYEHVIIEKDAITVNKDKTSSVLIPQDLPLNETVVYQGVGDEVPNLTIKRINYTTIEFDYFITDKKEGIIYQKKGSAYLSPTFYLAAEGTFEDGEETYGMNDYFGKDKDCEMKLLIGVGSIAQASFKLNCKDGRKADGRLMKRIQ